MPVKYKMFQIKNESSSANNKWYAKPVVSQVVGINQIAEKIEKNCSMKKSDVVAVLTELTEVFTEELLSGSRVVLEGIGSFKVKLSSKVADTPEAWTQDRNLTSASILFIPQKIDTRSAGKRTRSPKALKELKLEPYEQYALPTNETK